MTGEPERGLRGDPADGTGTEEVRATKDSSSPPNFVVQEAESGPADYVTALNRAKDIVKASVLYRRFIDGTPLENDIAVWMADFFFEQLKAVVKAGLLVPIATPEPCDHHWTVEAGYGPRGHGTSWCRTCGLTHVPAATQDEK